MADLDELLRPLWDGVGEAPPLHQLTRRVAARRRRRRVAVGVGLGAIGMVSGLVAASGTRTNEGAEVRTAEAPRGTQAADALPRLVSTATPSGFSLGSQGPDDLVLVEPVAPVPGYSYSFGREAAAGRAVIHLRCFGSYEGRGLLYPPGQAPGREQRRVRGKPAVWEIRNAGNTMIATLAWTERPNLYITIAMRTQGGVDVSEAEIFAFAEGLRVVD